MSSKGSSRPAIIAIVLVCFIGLTIWGVRWYLRPPVVSEGQLRYIQLLRTAVSAQNVEHVAGVERVLKKKVETSELTEREWRHFRWIIETAQSGQWERAAEACEGFEQAQQYR